MRNKRFRLVMLLIVLLGAWLGAMGAGHWVGLVIGGLAGWYVTLALTVWYQSSRIIGVGADPAGRGHYRSSYTVSLPRTPMPLQPSVEAANDPPVVPEGLDTRERTAEEHDSEDENG